MTDNSTVLASLRAQYEASRVERASIARLRSETPDRICRYCGKFWFQWAGSMLDGHAQCTVTPAFLIAFGSAVRGTVTPMREIAAALGVTESVAHAWWAKYSRMTVAQVEVRP